MMNRFSAIKVFFTLSMLLGVLSAAAAVPDNDDIYANTADAESPYYYPKLKMKYDHWESPMSDAELHYLYYGFTYTPEYKPLESDPHNTRVMEIMAKIAIEEPLVSDLDELIMNGALSLERDPFSPHMLNIMAYAYGALGDTEREKAYFERMNGILRTIERSGDGLREKSAMHIIMFSHGTDLIASKGWNYAKGRVVSRNTEYVPFDVPHDRVKGYYFDFSRIYWNKPENYTFKRERTWQFNNLRPREYK